MKTKFYLLMALIFILSCSNNQEPKKGELTKLRQSLLELSSQNKLEQTVLSDLYEDERNQIITELNNPKNALNLIDDALINGYSLLLEDIGSNMYPCIDINDLDEKYKGTKWESRNIGFPNSIARIEGAILLKDIQILKYEIFIMQLLDDDHLNSIVTRKEVLLKREMEELKQYTNEGIWVD